MSRVICEFAGIRFSGHQHGPDHVTVPIPAFKKMLLGGRVRPHLCYDIEHDGNGQYDRYSEDVANEGFIKSALERLERQGRPWLLYLAPARDGAKPVLHYCPHSNLSYSMTERGAA